MQYRQNDERTRNAIYFSFITKITHKNFKADIKNDKITGKSKM